MNRKHMNNTRNSGRKTVLHNSPLFGSVRAGMHQKNENEYHHSRCSAEISSEPVEKALDIPADLEEMIPPESEAPAQQAEISADAEVLTVIESDETEPTEEVTLSADYSAERIPELKPVTGGVSCEPYALVYDPGDGKPHAIPDPLGVLTDDGLYPFFPEVKDPAANVPAKSEI